MAGPLLLNNEDEERLLLDARWGPEEQLTAETLFYAHCGSGQRLGRDALCQLLVQEGIQPAYAAHIFRAMDRQGVGSLDVRDFMLGICAMTPSTPHTGDWLVLRARYIFRMYDTKVDGVLDFSEFRVIVRHLRRLRHAPLDDTSITAETQRLFACEGAFSEELFVHMFAPRLAPLFRLTGGAAGRAGHREKQLQIRRVSLPRSPPVCSSPAAAAVALNGTAEVETKKWLCAACTFENWPASVRCAMCYSPHAPVAATPVESRIRLEDLLDQELAALSPPDLLWLHACIAVADGSTGPVAAYMTHIEGSLTRSITKQDSKLLVHVTGRKGVFKERSSLIDLALDLNQQHIVSCSRKNTRTAIVCVFVCVTTES